MKTQKYDCDICKDDGKCLNNIKHPYYSDENDIYDCVNYLELLQGKVIDSWMLDWLKCMKIESQQNNSEFCKWNDSLKNNFNFHS